MNKVNTGILNINRFSNFEQLLRSTEYLFKCVSKLKGYDSKKKAIEYWIKNAQAEFFAKEIFFLENVMSLPWPYRQMYSCIRQKGERTSSKSPRR